MQLKNQDPSITNDLISTATDATIQVTGLSMNPVELFHLQQQQQQHLQLQQQIELQNLMVTQAAANLVAVASTNSLKAGKTVSDEQDCDDNEIDRSSQQQYLPNSFELSDCNSDQENALLCSDYSSNSNSSFLLGQQHQIFNVLNAKSSTSTQTSATRESFKKIKPVKRPGLVLKTPIAYQGDIDPSVIPIQRDGMGRNFPLPKVFMLFLF